MRSAALALLAPLSLAGCGLFVAEVDEPHLCLTLEEEEIPGTELPLQDRIFLYDLGPALPDRAESDRIELEVRLVDFELAARGGVDDFGFLERATIQLVEGTDPDAPGKQLAAWEAPADRPAGPVAVFDVDSSIDLGDAVSSRKLRLALRMEGTLPTQDWRVDATACFRVHSEIRYLE